MILSIDVNSTHTMAMRLSNLVIIMCLKSTNIDDLTKLHKITFLLSLFLIFV